MKKLIMVVMMCLGCMGMSSLAQGTTVGAPGVLNRGQAEKIMPISVFYRGQSESTQGRNSAGIRLEGGKLVLASLVDTSGYSSGIAERYQAYLLTEVRLKVGDKVLPPGAYGFGFIANDRMVVMDIGANEMINVATRRNDALKRPAPLQILNEEGAYRLYLGRSYVTLAPEAEK